MTQGEEHAAWDEAIRNNLELLARTRAHFTLDDLRESLSLRRDAPADPPDWAERLARLVETAEADGVVTVQRGDDGGVVRLAPGRSGRPTGAKARRRRRRAADRSKAADGASASARGAKSTPAAPRPRHEAAEDLGPYALGRRIARVLRGAILVFGALSTLGSLVFTTWTLSRAPGGTQFVVLTHGLFSLALIALSFAFAYLVILAIEAVFDIAENTESAVAEHDPVDAATAGSD